MGDEVPSRSVVTAAELDSMSPSQVDQVWRESLVTDPEGLPGEYVELIRRRAEERLARRETPAAS